MFNYTIELADEPTIILHNVDFARYNQRDHMFYFFTCATRDVIKVRQERIISITIDQPGVDRRCEDA